MIFPLKLANNSLKNKIFMEKIRSKKRMQCLSWFVNVPENLIISFIFIHESESHDESKIVIFIEQVFLSHKKTLELLIVFPFKTINK
jgi:aspartate carbamoyltransferase regulatory subunit